MKTIVGITVGPIVETISESKKISEIANASLFFSTIVEEFLKKISKNEKYKIITHSFNGEGNKDKFYPDRIVLEVKENLDKKIILEEIENIYFSIISSEEKLLELKDYLNFNIIVESFEEEKNIKDIFNYLNGIEVIKNFSVNSDSKDILKNINDYLKKKNEKKSLNPSYAVDFGNDAFNAEGGYRAIIALDIDKMTTFSQKTIEDIYKVSGSIYDYITELNNFLGEKVNNGKKEGLVLYSAGDDILAILNPKYIFEFIEFACNTLNKSFKKFKNRNLSVSFGIFVCYAKYPIKEAINKAHSLLFGKAKEKRNTASILFQKHSGQSFGLNLYDLIDKKSKEENIFNNKNPFFNHSKENINFESEDATKDRLLNTIVQKISMNEFVFRHIITKKDRIDNYLEDLFDEKEIGKNQLTILKDLLYYTGSLDNKVTDTEDKFQENLFQVLSFFRMLKFYISKGKGENN